jgi:hypothetical protein
MDRRFEGVTWRESDRNHGPFMIRIGGTSEFVSEIDPLWKRASPPGKVEVCEGWMNPNAMVFDTMDKALNAASKVWNIEGFHTSIETVDVDLSPSHVELALAFADD